MLTPQIMPAIVTPFDESGDLDLASHRHNVAFLAGDGVEGFVLAGSNGEGPYLESGERNALIGATREAAPDAHVMVGVMAESVRQGISQLEECGEADTALVMTPTTLTRSRPAAVLGYFKHLIEASLVPVFLYSVPPSTAYSLEVDLVAELAILPKVAGMKDSSGDVVRLQALRNATPDDVILYSGSSPAMSGAIAVGCDGVITGSVNYCHRLVAEVVAAASTPNAHSRKLQARLSALSAAIDGRGVPGVKAAATVNGLRPGLPRLPLAPLDAVGLEAIKEAMQAHR